jgi:mannose-6-phosphate isomerase
VGELWFERADNDAPIPALLLKLLFTSAPLSIQVNPDDTFARALGLPNGKSEAWYVDLGETGRADRRWLGAPNNAVRITGLARDGSIVELVRWRPVENGGVIFIPAGTIHAMGAGIVLAEIQQRSDTTFRFSTMAASANCDNGVAVANTWPLRSAHTQTNSPDGPANGPCGEPIFRSGAA